MKCAQNLIYKSLYSALIAGSIIVGLEATGVTSFIGAAEAAPQTFARLAMSGAKQRATIMSVCALLLDQEQLKTMQEPVAALNQVAALTVHLPVNQVMYGVKQLAQVIKYALSPQDAQKQILKIEIMLEMCDPQVWRPQHRQQRGLRQHQFDVLEKIV